MGSTKPAVVPASDKLNMDLHLSHTRVSGYGTVYRMNYDGVNTLGNFVDCSDSGTVP